MSASLIPYRNGFLIPGSYRYAGLIAGTPGSTALDVDRPAAMVLTDTEIKLCDERGPFFSVPLVSVTDVDVCEFKELSRIVDTSIGPQRVVPRSAFGVQITYSGISLAKRLRILVFYADVAYEWVAAIGRAIEELDARGHEAFRPGPG